MVCLKPIRDDNAYQAALAEIERLWNCEAGTADADRMEVLAILVEAYENQHFPIDPPDPVDAILFRMEQAGLSGKDLEPIFGSRRRFSEVLSRKRPLSIEMIRGLRDKLGISADVLIG